MDMKIIRKLSFVTKTENMCSNLVIKSLEYTGSLWNYDLTNNSRVTKRDNLLTNVICTGIYIGSRMQ